MLQKAWHKKNEGNCRRMRCNWTPFVDMENTRIKLNDDTDEQTSSHDLSSLSSEQTIETDLQQ